MNTEFRHQDTVDSGVRSFHNSCGMPPGLANGCNGVDARIHKMAVYNSNTNRRNMAATGPCSLPDVVPRSPAPTDNKRGSAVTQRLAKKLATDIVRHMSGVSNTNAVNSQARTLRRTGAELSQRHEILFRSMTNKLDFTDENGRDTFQNVADEIFADGHINWGRIVTLYAFAGHMAKKCVAKGMTSSYVDTIGEFVGQYIADKLSLWIDQAGGWEAFDEYFPEAPNLENSVWKGLLYGTMVGLGALVTMVAVK